MNAMVFLFLKTDFNISPIRQFPQDTNQFRLTAFKIELNSSWHELWKRSLFMLLGVGTALCPSHQ